MTQIRRFNALMDLQGVVVRAGRVGLGQSNTLFLRVLRKCAFKPHRGVV